MMNKPPGQGDVVPRRMRRAWLFYMLVPLVTLAAGFGFLVSFYSWQRWGLGNCFEVVPGAVVRCRQPEAAELRRWVGQYGIRTIVNLRGGEELPAVQDEIAIAKELGLDYRPIKLSNKDLPPSDALREYVRVLESGRRPVLVHCQAGADRTGVASVIAQMALEGKSFREASLQCSWLYLHLDPLPRHVDAVLSQYEEWCLANGRDTDGWPQFRKWLFEVYEYRFADKDP